ncbi:GLUG motif-containing protein [Halobellus rubicundus]|uniref:GLUG motif-containing protein n=1 Tax=Halobellus rubicundus TaxID=2996466 RepID=A0ABD5MFE4_9EURY
MRERGLCALFLALMLVLSTVPAPVGGTAIADPGKSINDNHISESNTESTTADSNPPVESSKSNSTEPDSNNSTKTLMGNLTEVNEPKNERLTGASIASTSEDSESNSYVIPLRTGNVTPKEGVQIEQDNISNTSSNDTYWTILQFYADKPTDAISELRSKDVVFVETVTDGTYYVAIPPEEINSINEIQFVRSIIDIKPKWKISPSLNSTISNATGEYEVSIRTFERLSYSNLSRIDNTTYRGSLTVSQIRQLQSINKVAWIEKYQEPNPSVAEGRRLVGAHKVDSQYDGEGVRVGIIDTGIDSDHPHFSGINIIDSYDWAGCDVDPEAPYTGIDNDHGTHVAGTVAGEGTHEGRTLTGVAPEATLVISRIFNDTGGFEVNNCGNIIGPGYDDLYNKVEQAGATIISNSWGHDSGGGYDQGAHSTDEWANNHPDTLVLFSGGNYGDDSEEYGIVENVTSPGLAKNALTVGSSLDGSSEFEPYGVASRLGEVSDSNNLDLPVDGRTKPDVVAPGEYITAPVVSPPGASEYGTKAGSSMAAPHVAGVAAMYKQAYPEAGAAEIKAAIIGTTHPVRNRLNYASGYGGTNVHNAIYNNSYESTANRFSGSLTRVADETDVYSFSVSPNAERVVVSTTWLDPESSISSSDTLVNDIDVCVGPVDDPSKYCADGDTNNVRKISIQDPESTGDWQITVDGNGIDPLHPTENYAGLVRVITEESTLSVDVPSEVIVTKGNNVTLPVTVQGTGAPVAAVTGEVSFNSESELAFNGSDRDFKVLPIGDLSSGYQNQAAAEIQTSEDTSLGSHSLSVTVSGVDNERGSISKSVNLNVVESSSLQPPSNPSPTDAASNIPTDSILEWESNNPDSVSYDIYLEKGDQTPALVAEDQSDTSYDPAGLEAGTTYYWKIVAEDGQGNTVESNLWSFTTRGSGSDSPSAPSNPVPENDSIGFSGDVTLSWSGSSNSDVSYNVYFGANSDPGFYTTTSSSEVTVSGLDRGTTYYWRVVADDGQTTSSSGVWTFSTSSGDSSISISDISFENDDRDGPMEIKDNQLEFGYMNYVEHIDGVQESDYDLRVVNERGTVIGVEEDNANEGEEFATDLELEGGALFREPGTYTVDAIVRHSISGDTFETSATVDVEHSPPEDEMSILPIEPRPYEEVTLDVSHIEEDTCDTGIEGYSWYVYKGDPDDGQVDVIKEEQGSSLSSTDLQLEGADEYTVTVSDTADVDGCVIDETTLYVEDDFGPDLDINGLSVPDTGSAGNPVSASVSMENTGSTQANYIIRFKADGNIVETETYHVDAGESDEESVSLSLTEGDHTISAEVIDASNERHALSESITINQNNPPEEPSNPSPGDGADSVGTDTVLQWSGDDPDGDAVSYDVYLEKGDPTPDEQVASGQSQSSYSPSNLERGSVYYWQIVATDEHGLTTRSPVWSFTTVVGPSASFSYSPQSPSIGSTVSFDASESEDPSGSIESYEWDFDGDGSIEATGISPDYTFNSAGEKVVSLTVTDSSGLVDTTSSTISVQEDVDESAPSISLSKTDGSALRINLTSSEPLSRISVDLIRGTTVVTNLRRSDFIERDVDNHTYTSNYSVDGSGDYTAILRTAEDSGGNDGGSGQSDTISIPDDSGDDRGDGSLVDIDASDLPGGGTRADPYQVSNASELQAMEDDPNAHYELVADIDASRTAQWGNERGFDPVSSFSGSLDGNNHTVTGLTIERPNESGIGLFSYIESATIEYVSLAQLGATGSEDVGGLAGSVGNSTVQNVAVSGNVQGSGFSVGGLAGNAYANSAIQDVTASGNVTGSNDVGGLVGSVDNSMIKSAIASGNVTGSGSVGGLVGEAEDNSRLQNISASGTVTGSSFVGGIVGFSASNSTIKSAAASGDVNGSSYFVGGLVGKARDNGTIQSATASGNVNGSDNVGGLVGRIIYNTALRNVTASGNVTGSSEVGGLVGQSRYNSTIKSATASGNVMGFENDVGGLVGDTIGNSTIKSAAASGDVNGSDFVGGLVGSSYSNSTIKSAAASGNVTGSYYAVGGLVGNAEGNSTLRNITASGNVEGIVGLGGLIGVSASYSTIQNATASGNVTGTYSLGGLVGDAKDHSSLQNVSASGDVNGSYSVGGLAGDVYNNSTLYDGRASGKVTGVDRVGGLVGSTYDNANIESSYATGNVSGTELIGGLVGSNNENSAVKSSYATGNVSGTEVIGGLVGYNDGNGIVTSSNASGYVNGSGWVGGLVAYNSDNTTVIASYATGNVNGTFQVGGLIGRNDNFNSLSQGGRVTLSYATGNVSGTYFTGGLIGINSDNATVESSYSTGNVNGSEVTGGFVGSAVHNSTIQNVTASGDVTGSTQVGGLVGENENDSVIQSAKASGNVTGSTQVGGLVGRNLGATIRDSFAVGYVTGDTQVGGLVGRNSGTVMDSYWDEQATGQTTSAGSAIGLTTAEMQGSAAASNMSGLDFDNIWVTKPSDYPVLAWDIDTGGDSDSPKELELTYPDVLYTISNPRKDPTVISNLVAVESDTELAFDNGSNYQFVFVREGQPQFTASVTESVTIANDSEFALLFFGSQGDPVSGSPKLHRYTSTGVEKYNLTVESGSIPTERGLINYSIKLRSEDGEAVAATASRPLIFGYEGEPTTSINDDTITVSMPKQFFPRDTEAILRVYDTAKTWEATPILTRTLRVDNNTDSFRTNISQSVLPAGDYGYVVSLETPSGASLNISTSFTDDALSVTPVENVSNIASFSETVRLGSDQVDADLAGQIRVEKSVASSDKTSVDVLRSSSTNYSIAISAPDDAENVTFYLQTQAISASQDIDDLTMYLDGEEQPFVVNKSGGPGQSSWVAFNVPHFSTRTVSFTTTSNWSRSYETDQAATSRFGELIKAGDGGVVLAGVTDANVSDSGSETNVTVLKAGSDGNREWITTADPGYVDTSKDIIRTSDGGFVTVGIDTFVKLDSNGSVVWQRADDLSGGTYEAIVESDGSAMFLAGNTCCSDDRKSRFIRTDSGGVEQWNRTLSITNDSYGALSYSGAGLGDGAVFSVAGFNSEPTYLYALQADGSKRWERTVPNLSSPQLQTLPDGDILVTGTNETTGSLRVVRVTPSNNVEWDRTYDTGPPIDVTVFDGNISAVTEDKEILRLSDSGDRMGVGNYSVPENTTVYSAVQTGLGEFVLGGDQGATEAESQFWLSKITVSSTNTTTETSPEVRSAVQYRQADGSPAIEVAFSEPVQNLSGNFELYADGAQIDTTNTTVQIDGGRAVIELDQVIISELTLRLEDGIVSTEDVPLDTPQNVSVTRAPVSVHSGDNVGVYRGSILAVVTDTVNSDVTISQNGTLVQELSTGSDSRIALLDTEAVSTGDYQVSVAGVETSTFEVARLEFAASVDSSTVNTSATLSGTIESNVAAREIRIGLVNESSSSVAVSQVYTLDGQGEAAFSFDLADTDISAGDYQIRVTDRFTGIQRQVASINVTSTDGDSSDGGGGTGPGGGGSDDGEISTEITDLTLTRTTIDEGDSVGVEAVVYNNGTETTNASYTLEVYRDGTLQEGIGSSSQVDNLEPGENATLVYLPTFEEPGEYTLIVGDQLATLTVQNTSTTTTTTEEPISTTPAETTGSEAPGFGPLATIIALVGAAVLLFSRRGSV